MSQVNQEMNLALLNATAIGEMAKNARIQSENILNESYALIERHEKFLNPTGIQSSDIAMKVEEVKFTINTIVQYNFYYLSVHCINFCKFYV